MVALNASITPNDKFGTAKILQEQPYRDDLNDYGITDVTPGQSMPVTPLRNGR